MSTWRWILLIGLALGCVFGLSTLVEHVVWLTVEVWLDGEPADAAVKLLRRGAVVGVHYTDVHTPGVAHFPLVDRAHRLRVERGAGYTTVPRTLEVLGEADAPLRVQVTLERRFDPREHDYYAADLHAHTAASAPPMERDYGLKRHGTTPVDQAVGVQLAADLDVAFISDHNTVDGHALFAETARARGVPALLSQEVTTRHWGHFSPYGLDEGRGVSFDFEKRPGALFAEARASGAQVIQVNHPYWPGIGYFELEGRPLYLPSFDAVEVFNGPFSAGDRRTIHRMYGFWDEGRHYVATAGSDDHDWEKLDLAYGTPRTYVRLEEALTTASFVAALKAGRAFVTYGPLIYLTLDGEAEPGDTLRRRAGEAVEVRARVQGVDPLDGLVAEVVRNRTLVERVPLFGHDQAVALEDAAPEGGGWYALRVLDRRGRYVALTNPVWVEADPAG